MSFFRRYSLSSCLCLIIVMILWFLPVQYTLAQSKLNNGLSKPQEKSTLPKSKAVYIPPVKKSKVKPEPVLINIGNEEYKLSGGWELADGLGIKVNGGEVSSTNYNSTSWYNAVVPGTVLSSLVKQGIYPHPYFGLNNLMIPDSLCRRDWWYRTSFKLPLGKSNKHAYLNFNGINYQAEIYLNKKYVGTIKGGFKQGFFDVTRLLTAKKDNIIAVHIFPPPHPGIPHEESPSAGTGPNGGTLCLDGPTFISSEGWDWVPGIRDRNIGIWQDVSLQFKGNVMINNIHIVTDLPLPDTSKASIKIATELNNLTGNTQLVLLKGKIGNVAFKELITLMPNEYKKVVFSPAKFKQLRFDHPRLWWPNGYGSPELYTLELKATVNGIIADSKSTRFGIRELSYDMTVDFPGHIPTRINFNPITALKSGKPIFDNLNRREVTDNVVVGSLIEGANIDLLPKLKDTSSAPYLVLRVNGKKIFCKGGNWGMDDAMKEVSKSHLEPYFILHRDAHFNMIRNWTGESTEEVFYDLCDEYGMLVWNDFWLSTEGYNLDVRDNDLFISNAEDAVRRFRNHPSIAIWCPRNEGYAPVALENALSTMIAKLDGTRYYQPNSRSFNLRTSGPWHYFKKPEKYADLAAGFNTELGTPSIPSAASMKKMMAKEDQWPISDVWYYHDFHDGQKDFVTAMDSLYGKALDLENFCKKAQMLNYDSHRAMFEAWNNNLWNKTTGLLLWMTHPAWPSTVWQTYSWDYETFGSYFGCMKACEPVHIQLNSKEHKVVIVNTSLKRYFNCTAQLTLFNLKGEATVSRTQRLSIKENQLSNVFDFDYPDHLSGNYLLRLSLIDSKGKTLSINEYWKNLGDAKDFLSFNQLANATLKARVSRNKEANKKLVTLTNTSSVPAIAIKLNLVNILTKEIILPAYFSDGLFNLMPGESKTISVSTPYVGMTYFDVSGYNINLHTITADK